jgi:predicted house-cleaning noncanonical NTP pyrophosphatase (MazG superfamily)
MYDVTMTLDELVFIRQSLDAVNIQGKNAKFVAQLQIKLENEIEEIKKHVEEQEREKLSALSEVVAPTSKKK